MTEAAGAPVPFSVNPLDVPHDQSEAVLDGAIVAPCGDHVIEVTGPGAVACMQGLLTNDLEAPGEDAFLYAAVLTNKGMIVSDLWASRSGVTVTLTAPAAGYDAITEILGKSLPPRLAKTTDRSAAHAVLRLAGPRALEYAEKAGFAIPAPGRSTRSAFRPSDCYVSRPPLGLPFALQVLVAREDAPVVIDALERAGARPAAEPALDLARILGGWPRLGAEIDQKTLPQEVRYDDINGVSYTKGCYTGQETVARIHFRGHANRHLVGLTWQDAPNLQHAEIQQDDKTIGRVSSVAWLAPLDHYIGLGVVRRETDLTRPVTASGAPARAADLPLRLAS